MVEYPQVSRPFAPQGPAEAYKTYRILSPWSRRRPASCREIECERWELGWLTALDVSIPAHAETATWIRMKSGRKFTVAELGTSVTFTFPPGQSCFRQHSVPVREPVFLVHHGDFRGNPRGLPATRHSGVESWVDDFACNQQAIRDRVNRG
jgi:hypothetical protein